MSTISEHLRDFTILVVVAGVLVAFVVFAAVTWYMTQRRDKPPSVLNNVVSFTLIALMIVGALIAFLYALTRSLTA